MTNKIDLFYPLSDTLSKGGAGAIISWKVKVSSHLTAAKAGDRVGESKLINRLGQLRRCYPDAIPDWALDVVKSSVEFLRSTGRNLNFNSQNPAIWITMRDGSPRW